MSMRIIRMRLLRDGKRSSIICFGNVLALQNYLEQYGKYKSDIIVLDSPILTLKERVSVKASEGMQASLFKYLIGHQSGYQTIVIENDPPKIDYTGVNMIHFTQEEDGSRYGLLKGVK